jgi:hypothetical protein
MFEHCARHLEAGLDLYQEARWLGQDERFSARTACALFARAGRAALRGLMAALDQSATTPSNLPSLLGALDEAGYSFPQFAVTYAERLTRVLVLDRFDSGYDYLTRDLFGTSDVLECDLFAAYFLDCSLRSLRAVSLDQALRHRGDQHGTLLRTL